MGPSSYCDQLGLSGPSGELESQVATESPQPDLLKGPNEDPIDLHSLCNGRDWNEEFQALVGRNKGKTKTTPDKVLALRQLCTVFAQTATEIGKKIISELHLPDEDKVIPPITKFEENLTTNSPFRKVGGFAGGTKYCHQSIFFKFPIDENNLYSGPEGLMKACGHDIKGLMAFIDCCIEDFHFPLMTTIDYNANNCRGWRLVAQSVLPIRAKETLVYGSCDAGSTIFVTRPEISNKMLAAAKIMNLASEAVLDAENKKHILHTSCDVEVHQGRDGRFYVLDYARVMPPAQPDPKIRGSFLYRLLRPEFVRTNPTPLCSDSFSGFNIENRAIHEKEIANATTYLEHKVIPKFARSFRLKPHDHEGLVMTLHRNGINLRYLGLVRSHTTNPKMQRLILTEMVARVLKHALRGFLRNAIGEADLVSACQRFMNKVFSDSSFTYWEVTIKPQLKKRFRVWQINEEEPSCNLKHELVNISSLATRISALCGFKISESTLDKFRVTHKAMIQSQQPFEDGSILECYAIVKHIHRISFQEGIVYSQMALDSGQTRDIFLDIGEQKYRECLQLKPDDYRSLHNLGYSHLLRAYHKGMDQRLLEKASEYFIEALNSTNKVEQKPPSMFKLGTCQLNLAKQEADPELAVALTKKALITFEKACEIDSSAYALTKWAHALFRQASILNEITERNDTQKAKIPPQLILELIQQSCKKWRAAAKMDQEKIEKEKTQRNLVQWGIALAKRAKLEDASKSKKSFHKALALFQKALELDDKYHYGLFNWGNTLFHKGRKDKDKKLLLAAAEKYKKCLEIAPPNLTLNNSAFSNWGKVLTILCNLVREKTSVPPGRHFPPIKPVSGIRHDQATLNTMCSYFEAFKAMARQDPRNVSLSEISDLLSLKENVINQKIQNVMGSKEIDKCLRQSFVPEEQQNIWSQLQRRASWSQRQPQKRKHRQIDLTADSKDKKPESKKVSPVLDLTESYGNELHQSKSLFLSQFNFRQKGVLKFDGKKRPKKLPRDMPKELTRINRAGILSTANTKAHEISLLDKKDSHKPNRLKRKREEEIPPKQMKLKKSFEPKKEAKEELGSVANVIDLTLPLSPSNDELTPTKEGSLLTPPVHNEPSCGYGSSQTQETPFARQESQGSPLTPFVFSQSSQGPLDVMFYSPSNSQVEPNSPIQIRSGLSQGRPPSRGDWSVIQAFHEDSLSKFVQIQHRTNGETKIVHVSHHHGDTTDLQSRMNRK